MKNKTFFLIGGIFILILIVAIGAGFLFLRSANSVFAAGFWSPAQTPVTPGENEGYMSPYGWMGGMHGFGRYDAPGRWGMPGGCSTYGDMVSETGEPLSVEAAQNAVKDFLDSYGYEGLSIKEVMIFDNHAYVEVVETETGIGAMELLVDPVTLAVFPEHGANMMWNLKYNVMHGGRGYGMMNRWNRSGSIDLADMPISPEEARQIAQEYLDRLNFGLDASDEVDTFYGYYTLHTEENGEVVGMLSVNGYSGQVIYHTWHGELLEMSEGHD